MTSVAEMVWVDDPGPETVTSGQVMSDSRWVRVSLLIGHLVSYLVPGCDVRAKPALDDRIGANLRSGKRLLVREVEPV